MAKCVPFSHVFFILFLTALAVLTDSGWIKVEYDDDPYSGIFRKLHDLDSSTLLKCSWDDDYDICTVQNKMFNPRAMKETQIDDAFIEPYHVLINLTNYTIISSYLSESHPTDWVMKGSNDYRLWSVIDERHEENKCNTTFCFFGHKVYECKNPGVYKMFQLSILKTSNEKEKASIAGMEFFGFFRKKDGARLNRGIFSPIRWIFFYLCESMFSITPPKVQILEGITESVNL